MKTLSIREMRSALGRLDHLLEQESEIVVARRGRPIARLLPVGRRGRMPSRSEFRSAQPRLTASTELIRQDRDAR
jgi:antitoxin (DNA-binding transcriptional repressor) of toxin-antitoxin stability system